MFHEIILSWPISSTLTLMFLQSIYRLHIATMNVCLLYRGRHPTIHILYYMLRVLACLTCHEFKSSAVTLSLILYNVLRTWPHIHGAFDGIDVVTDHIEWGFHVFSFKLGKYSQGWLGSNRQTLFLPTFFLPSLALVICIRTGVGMP